MPRPYKTGLDYFSIDTDFFENTKIEDLRWKFGATGISVYIAILCMIYSKGYYIRFINRESLVRTLSIKIASERDQLKQLSSRISEIIDYLLEMGMIDNALFEENILSSRSVQEQYSYCISSMKRKVVLEEYNLLLGESIPENNENSEKTAVNSEEIQVNSENGTQSKNKVNNKINNSITTTTDAHARVIPSDLEIVEYFGKKLTEDRAGVEAFRWKRLNEEKYGWSCLPDWKSAADRWIENMK